jgi:hypothetical protein
VFGGQDHQIILYLVGEAHWQKRADGYEGVMVDGDVSAKQSDDDAWIDGKEDEVNLWRGKDFDHERGEKTVLIEH